MRLPTLLSVSSLYAYYDCIRSSFNETSAYCFLDKLQKAEYNLILGIFVDLSMQPVVYQQMVIQVLHH
jgi:hypothetical protein